MIHPLDFAGLKRKNPVCAPASSSASRGFVISTCSKPSATRMATFLPSSFRAINIPPVDVDCFGREIDRTKCYEAQRTIGCKARGISAFAFGRDAVCLRGNFKLFDLLLNF